MRKIIVIAHDIRSIHNVGSLMRTAEGLGVEKMYLTGYTPYPQTHPDSRLPHIYQKISKQMNKTALGAELSLPWEHAEDVYPVIDKLKSEGYEVCALEQAASAISLPDYRPSDKVALLLGREVEGIDQKLLGASDNCVAIPMFGTKESFNVVQATAMALYHICFSQ